MPSITTHILFVNVGIRVSECIRSKNVKGRFVLTYHDLSSRSAIMVDPTTLKPTADTTLRAGGVVQLAMVTPADVNSKKNPTVVNEHVTKVDPASHQIVWGGGRLPTLFRAELAQALSTTPDGKTRYENRHVFSGVSGHVIRTFMGKTMQDAAQATADALKQRAEGQHA